MKYIILNIDREKQCTHDMFGITCERNHEILDHIGKIADVMLKMGVSIKNHGVEQVIRESLEIAKNENEALYICFFLGDTSSAYLGENL